MGHTHEMCIWELALQTAQQIRLLAPAIVTVYITFGGGVADLVTLVTFRSFQGLVSFIYFLSLVCFLPALLYLSPPSRWKCFNLEKVSMGTK